MKVFATTVIMLAISALTHAEIYKWRDAEGKLHFSDKPMAGSARQVDLFDSDGGKVQAVRQADPSSGKAGDRTHPGNSPRRITADDYKINSSAKFDRDGVTISGRINGGPKCDNLTVNAYATSKNGRSASCTDVTSTRGFGSTVFSCIDPWENDRLDFWEVSGVYVTCRD